MADTHTLGLKNVAVKRADKVIIDNINIDFHDKQIYTIIGKSGTGKSTLLNIIAGLRTFSGKITLDNEEYFPKNQAIALVPQNFGLLPWQTAWDAVENALKISKGKLTTEDKQKIEQLFEELDLSAVKNQYPNRLSGGQQQRVSLARAFSLDAKFLLMDEPFSALDAITREKIQELFLKIWKERKRTTLFITHDIEEAILLGDKIVIMEGKPGRVKEIIDNPLKDLTLEEKRTSSEFFKWANELRKELY